LGIFAHCQSGAITDASSEVFAKLSAEKQKELLTAYFDKEGGIGYTVVRTSIHSSDFGSGSHTYIEESDKSLETFNIDKDREFRIPLIKRATEAAGGDITFYASPWSAPAFMKSNNNMLRGGKLLPEYYETWAMYFAKFIKAYEAEGMPVWGVTIQNEPMAVQRWESTIYNAEEERDFLKNYLGPVLEREGLGDKKIFVWDHNRDLIIRRVNVIFEDPEAAKYAWGIGFHFHADTRTDELIYTPTYYYLGHFSKFVRPQAQRMSTSSSRNFLLATSFINEDNQMATIVMNHTNKAVNYNLFVGEEQAKLTIPPRAMQTLVY
jgi:glucosylceramidase